MKKNWINGRGMPLSILKKTFLVVKLTFLFTLLFTMSVLATGFAQNNKVSLQMQNTSLEKIIVELRNQTGIRFFYSIDKIKSINNLSVNVKDEALKNVLSQLLKNTNLTFTLLDEVIVIKDKAPGVVNDSVKRVTVKGVVRDTKGETLPGVSVLIKGTSLGVSTNVEGEFLLNVSQQDSVVLVFSFVGMERKEVKISGLGHVTIKSLNVTMRDAESELGEVIVTGYQSIRKSDMVGSTNVVKTGRSFL